ncbi:MAG: DP-EP family protein [Burkholderiaceae bacterium]|nr:DP-EP family protein [Burkholderiaceae bacterium]
MSTTPTSFINVQVISVPVADAAPHEKKYKTTFNPKKITIHEKDTVINYQLIAPTPEGVQFKSVTIAPDHNNQFSDPSISESGKIVTFSDANTVKSDFNITLHFIDKDNIAFSVDPEVINDPDPDLP